eukprot:TRINITY_DN11573_c0_g1_i1.p1 TRINITY_DN11573_c0_g1~~TRINITY_DN11573_c0_g1_i1.p1  ORF type:complete len:870 (-),score=238.59 TRINITY_DN11573_c0_g1_i1:36-2621(-)
MSSKYFSNTKKGEIPELRSDLNSLKEDKKKEAVKKVIALMTVGKDVSMLFPDVLKCMQTSNLELKKLVYLYLMNYAKTHPDLAILAVSTFQKDASDSNPLIRALAIRTMGCIRVPKVVEYLCDPLRECLEDDNPYVAKTAAICVAKLYDINPELVETGGFIEILLDLLNDNNPMVVSNAVAALSEIDSVSEHPIFELTRSNLTKLITAIEECTEWGQVFILNCLGDYNPTSSREATVICDRISPRLAHANSAVVMASIKVIIKYMDFIQDTETCVNLLQKLRPPLVTLMSKQPEIQYVALRNISLVLRKEPNLLDGQMQVFFCKYNDPLYVKMEKLEIMIMLANDQNIEQVLLEFKEYATKIDVEFVRKAIRAIGRCAIKLESSAEKSVHVLLALIGNAVDNENGRNAVTYLVQEAIVVIKDIFRKYPNRYESIISTLCTFLDTIDEPEAKAAMIWIIGEYADRIDDAYDILYGFLENFVDEEAEVQLQLLTAVVKLFLHKPVSSQEFIQEILNIATTEIDNPDIRDRGFVYWRLLVDAPQLAKQVVLAPKPLINEESDQFDPQVLKELLANMSSLASVYHKPPETFVPKLRNIQRKPRSGPAESREPVQFIDIPNSELLSAQDGNGLCIKGAFRTRGNNTFLDLTLNNQSQTNITKFQIMFNRNMYQLKENESKYNINIPTGSSKDLTIECNGSHEKNNEERVEVAINCEAVSTRFFVSAPIHALFVEDGKFDQETFVQLINELPETRFTLDIRLNTFQTEEISQSLEEYKLFLVATRDIPEGIFIFLSALLFDGTPLIIQLSKEEDDINLVVYADDDFVPLVENLVRQVLGSGDQPEAPFEVPEVATPGPSSGNLISFI